MNILIQNKFQAGRNYSGAVQLPPGRVIELLLLALFKIKPEQQGMVKHEQFFFFLYKICIYEQRLLKGLTIYLWNQWDANILMLIYVH